MIYVTIHIFFGSHVIKVWSASITDLNECAFIPHINVLWNILSCLVIKKIFGTHEIQAHNEHVFCCELTYKREQKKIEA